MLFDRLLRRTAAAVSLALLVPAAALAHPGEGGATPNPALLSSLVAAGGGSTAFSAKALRQNLGGPAEEAKLRAALGAAAVTRYDDVFSFVVRDGLATMSKNGETLPAPNPAPSNGKALAVALFKAGLHDGDFDIERLFDTLFSQSVHMHAMMAVAQKYGAPGESAYHQVFGRLVADVGGNGAPVDLKADERMHHMNGMDMKGMDMKGMSMPSPGATSTPH